MVGILVSFWETLFSGAMLVLGSVNPEKKTASCCSNSSRKKQIAGRAMDLGSQGFLADFFSADVRVLLGLVELLSRYGNSLGDCFFVIFCLETNRLKLFLMVGQQKDVGWILRLCKIDGFNMYNSL